MPCDLMKNRMDNVISNTGVQYTSQHLEQLMVMYLPEERLLHYKTLFQSKDSWGSGIISCKNCIQEADMKKIFQEFDEDDDGYISESDLKNLFLRLGDKEITDSEIQDMIREFDPKDNKVSYEEFVVYVVHVAERPSKSMQ